MAELHPVELWLPDEEIDALDQACGLWMSDRKAERSWFIHTCLWYGLLCLREEGLLTLDLDTPPEFVRQYEEYVAAYREENDSAAAELAGSDTAPE